LGGILSPALGLAAAGRDLKSRPKPGSKVLAALRLQARTALGLEAKQRSPPRSSRGAKLEGSTYIPGKIEGKQLKEFEEKLSR
jgi:hypothetical protein